MATMFDSDHFILLMTCQCRFIFMNIFLVRRRLFLLLNKLVFDMAREIILFKRTRITGGENESAQGEHLSALMNPI